MHELFKTSGVRVGVRPAAGIRCSVLCLSIVIVPVLGDFEFSDDLSSLSFQIGSHRERERVWASGFGLCGDTRQGDVAKPGGEEVQLIRKQRSGHLGCVKVFPVRMSIDDGR